MSIGKDIQCPVLQSVEIPFVLPVIYPNCWSIGQPSGGIDPDGDWILADGTWNDDGIWLNSETWNDGD